MKKKIKNSWNGWGFLYKLNLFGISDPFLVLKGEKNYILRLYMFSFCITRSPIIEVSGSMIYYPRINATLPPPQTPLSIDMPNPLLPAPNLPPPPAPWPITRCPSTTPPPLDADGVSHKYLGPAVIGLTLMCYIVANTQTQKHSKHLQIHCTLNKYTYRG